MVKPYCQTVPATARPLGTGCVRGFRSGGRVSPQRILMSKNIYVGNLTFQTTADDLRELFAQYGTVTSAQVVSDRDTGRSRGFGFVEMSEGGDEAIAALNGKDVGGRTLTVNEAKPREERPRGGSGGRGGYGGGGRGGSGGSGGGRGGYGGRY